MEQNPQEPEQMEEFEVSEQPAVQVRPQVQHPQLMETITRKIVQPVAPRDPVYNTGYAMGRVNKTGVNETQKTASDREWLDDLRAKPESMDWVFKPLRYQPGRKTDGTPLKSTLINQSGQLCTYPMQPYDSLIEEIANAWGGGAFQIRVCSGNGAPIESIKRTFDVIIPTNTYPPKAEEYEVFEPVAGKSAAPATATTAESEELKAERQALKDDEEREKLEKRRRDLEARRQKSELENMRVQAEMAKIRADLANPRRDDTENIKVEQMRKELEEQRRRNEEILKQQDDARKEERLRYERQMEKMEVDRKEETRRRDDELKEERRRHEELMREMRTAEPKEDKILPLIMAMINQPKPPDTTLPLMLEMGKNQASIVTAALQKQPENNSQLEMFKTLILAMQPKEKDNALVTTLLTAVVGKKNEQMTAEKVVELMDKGEERAQRWMQMAQQNNPQNDAEENGYDPKLGLLGNAGKAIFNSLSSLVSMAASNPQILELVKSIVGSRNPTQDELFNASYRLEQQQGIPPALPYQQNPGLPYQPPQQQFQGPPPLVQPMRNPPPVQSQPMQQPEQQAVVNELEGESGAPITEPEAELTAEQMAEQNIRDNVNDTVQIMIKEYGTHAVERKWMKHATDTWNRSFVTQLINLPIESQRYDLIGKKCDPESWTKLVSICTAEGGREFARFSVDFRSFIEANLKPVVVAEAPLPPVQAEPVPAAAQQAE